MFHENVLLEIVDKYSDLIYLYLPLGIIGLWRWSIWLLKVSLALFYQPKKRQLKAFVSIVTPVYNENPKIFARALKSWEVNNPKEIIAIIDYTDKACIELFRKFAHKFKGAKLIITKLPGKRPALALGIKKTKGEIVALVDSDTIWSKGVIKNGLAPFVDPKVAGVTVRANVLNPKTLAQKLFDIQLDTRYFVDYQFLSNVTDALFCLNGRTSFYRRKILYSLSKGLLNETFLGQPVISGDDKRLTNLILASGWKVAYQSNAHILTPGAEKISTYLKQRLRWTRNELRASIQSIIDGWMFKYPILLFFQIDKFIQGVTVLLSPIYFLLSLSLKLWIPALIIFLWWILSRSIKIYPHLIRRPQDLSILPIFILFTFVSAIIKLYAFFTLNTQGWITRWHISRLPQTKFLQRVPAYLTTFSVCLILTTVITTTKQTAFTPKVFAQIYQNTQGLIKASSFQILNPTKTNEEWFMTLYLVKEGDSLSKIASYFKVKEEQIILANMAFLPKVNLLLPGLMLAIPKQDLKIDYKSNYHTSVKYFPRPQIFVDDKSNTIFVIGRGNIVKLSDIANVVGEEYLLQTRPKEWYLKSNLLVKDGVTLKLEKEEVEWLRLASEKSGFITLKVINGTIIINGIKITSWDESKNDYDKDLEDGRSFIIAKHSSRLNIYNSELSYLGYPPLQKQEAAYGVSWKVPLASLNKYLLTGEVKNSKFHHNFFGAYTFGAKGMVFSGNEFYDNINYGLNLGESSNFLIVDNKIYSNKTGGIILNQNSNNNTIEDNTIKDNNNGVQLIGSNQNIVVNNSIIRNSQGVSLSNNADRNNIYDNSLEENSIALLIKTSNNIILNNIIAKNRTGIYLKDKASNNNLVKNNLENNRLFSILTRADKGNKNFLVEN